MTDTTTPTAGSWPAVGDRVAEYDYGKPVTVATVARLTATRIVLDNEHTYRRDNLTRVGDRYGKKLRPLSAPEVARRRAADLAAHAAWLAHSAVQGGHGKGHAGYVDALRQIITDATAALVDLADVRDRPVGIAAALPVRSVVATDTAVMIKREISPAHGRHLPWLTTSGEGWKNGWLSDRNVDELLTDGRAEVVRVGPWISSTAPADVPVAEG